MLNVVLASVPPWKQLIVFNDLRARERGAEGSDTCLASICSHDSNLNSNIAYGPQSSELALPGESWPKSNIHNQLDWDRGLCTCSARSVCLHGPYILRLFQQSPFCCFQFTSLWFTVGRVVTKWTLTSVIMVLAPCGIIADIYVHACIPKSRL